MHYWAFALPFPFILLFASKLLDDGLSSLTAGSLSSFFASFFTSLGLSEAFKGAEVLEVTRVYRIEPRKTIPAPIPSCAFHPLPNHQTLKQRLMALRVVSTMFVETEEMR